MFVDTHSYYFFSLFRDRLLHYLKEPQKQIKRESEQEQKKNIRYWICSLETREDPLALSGIESDSKSSLLSHLIE